MFNILILPDADRFWEVVEKSAGRVFLHLPDDTLVDLKEDHTAQQLLRAMNLGQNGLRFSLSESSDLPEFIRYMAESCY